MAAKKIKTAHEQAVEKASKDVTASSVRVELARQELAAAQAELKGRRGTLDDLIDGKVKPEDVLKPPGAASVAPTNGHLAAA